MRCATCCGSRDRRPSMPPARHGFAPRSMRRGRTPAAHAQLEAGVAIAAAAVLVVAIALTLVNWLRERGAPQAAAPIASTLFVTSEVVFQHDGQARAGRVGESCAGHSHHDAWRSRRDRPGEWCRAAS